MPLKNNFKHMRSFLLLLFTLFTIACYAQNNKDSLVVVKIKVWDKINNAPIQNIQIISYESMQMFITDGNGSFRSSFSVSDSLKINGIGYEQFTLKVKNFAQTDDYLNIYLERKSIMIRSVDVAPKRELALHLPDDIKLGNKNETPTSLRNDSYSKRPNILAAAFTPLSFAQYHLSKSEKEKRKAKVLIAKSKDNAEINKFFNKDIIAEVSKYTGEKLERFIVFCNINLKVNKYDNHLIVKQSILDLKDTFENEIEIKKEKKKRKKSKVKKYRRTRKPIG